MFWLSKDQADLYNKAGSTGKPVNGHVFMEKMAEVVDCDRFEEVSGKTYCPDNGRLAISTRMLVELLYLKYKHYQLVSIQGHKCS